MDLFLSQVTAANDPELIARLRRHDPAAAGEVYERYGKLLFSLILNIVGDRDDAEALLTEVLLKASNKLNDFEDNDFAFGPWLLVLARNHALEFRGGTRCLTSRDLPWESLETAVVYQQGSTSDDFLGTPAEQKGFIALPEVNRLVLELAWFEGMTLEEIASRVNASVSETLGIAEDSLEKVRES